MAKKSWRNSTNPSEIMELIQDININKFNVLSYFGINQKNLEMLEKLLKSGYYTPEEIAERDNRAYAAWTYAPAREILIDFANLAWQKLDDVQKILSAPCLATSKHEAFLMKLKYFEQHNPEIYEQLLETNSGLVYLRGLFVELALEPEKNKDQLFNILIKQPNVLDELDLNTPRVQGVLSVFTKAEFNQIQAKLNQIRKLRRDWRTATSVELIMYRATQENKWEIFEYFANHNEKIFNSIVKQYVSKYPAVKKIYSRSEILERYSDVDLDTLPECLKNYILSSKQSTVEEEELKQQRKEEKTLARAQAKKEKLSSWEDENGLTILLFKVGSITPISKVDYEKVLKKYLNEDLGITAFCSKYKISDVEGFKTMLKKFSAENSTYAEQIKSKSSQQQAQYLGTARNDIRKICFGDESVGSIIKYYTFERLQDIASKLFQDKKYCEILTIKVIQYYYARLNSYTDSIEPENIDKMLTSDEIRFIVGNEEYSSMMTGKMCDIGRAFLKRVSSLNSTYPALINNKVRNKRSDSIIKGISKYNTKFKANEYFRGKTFLITENGEQVEVTREMVEMAYQYAYSKKLHTSTTVMGYLIKAVVNGKIQNVEETKQDRKEMISKALALISEITNIDEYFTAIDNLPQ